MLASSMCLKRSTHFSGGRVSSLRGLYSWHFVHGEIASLREFQTDVLDTRVCLRSAPKHRPTAVSLDGSGRVSRIRAHMEFEVET